MPLAWAINAAQLLLINASKADDSTDASAGSASGLGIPRRLIANAPFSMVLDDALISAVMLSPASTIRSLAVLQRALTGLPVAIYDVCSKFRCERLATPTFLLALRQYGGGIVHVLYALQFACSVIGVLREESAKGVAVFRTALTDCLARVRTPSWNCVAAHCFQALIDPTFLIWDQLQPLWLALKPFWCLLATGTSTPLACVLPSLLTACDMARAGGESILSRYNNLAVDVSHILRLWPSTTFACSDAGIGLGPTASAAHSYGSAGTTPLSKITIDAELLCAFQECPTVDEDALPVHQTVSLNWAGAGESIRLTSGLELFKLLQKADELRRSDVAAGHEGVFRGLFSDLHAAMQSDCTSSHGHHSTAASKLLHSLLPGTLPGLQQLTSDFLKSLWQDAGRDSQWPLNSCEGVCTSCTDTSTYYFLWFLRTNLS